MVSLKIKLPPPPTKRYAPEGMLPEHVALARRLQQINRVDCKNGNVLTVLQKFDELMISVTATCDLDAIDGLTAPVDESEGWALVVTGPSAAGKTNALNRVAKDPRLKPLMLEGYERRTFVQISAPSPCTTKTLAFDILSQFGTHMEGRTYEHELWFMVRQHLIAFQVQVLQIDEAHHVLIGRSTEEEKKFAETLKNLMKGVPIMVPPNLSAEEAAIIGDATVRHPLHLIIAGTPNLAEFCKNRSNESRVQLANRCIPMPFEEISVERAEDGVVTYNELPEFLTSLLRKLGLESETEALLTPDMQKRHVKSGIGQLGRIALIFKSAARLQALAREEVTFQKALELAFEAVYATGSLKNCYMVTDIDQCPKPPEPILEEARASFRKPGKKK